MFDLVVIGDVVPDLILTGTDVQPTFGQAEKLVDEARLTPGGSAVITACAASKLGLDTTLVGLVGDDMFGSYMLEALSTSGVDTTFCTVDPGLRTGLTVILQDAGDRAMLTDGQSIGAMGRGHVADDAIGLARHVHVGSAFMLSGLADDIGDIFRQAHVGGATTSLDTNWDPKLRWDTRDWLDHCDLLLPNDQEALALTGAHVLIEALQALAALTGTVATKQGSEGGTAVRGDQSAHAPSIAMATFDTIGAGDNFNAGMVYGHIHHWTLRRSLELAVACGSLSMRAAGGTGAQPTRDEAMAFVDSGA